MQIPEHKRYMFIVDTDTNTPTVLVGVITKIRLGAEALTYLENNKTCPRGLTDEEYFERNFTRYGSKFIQWLDDTWKTE